MNSVLKIQVFWVVTLSSRVIYFWCFEGRSRSPRRIFTGPFDPWRPYITLKQWESLTLVPSV